ncbi:LacI family DNA-binding transcriptional regulator [Candidatus Xianfuyuplasma coldseepsis]|nr:LacI family DNA-binding transcriptional regulator [Xianfuyuplasma coldseepsis]
MPTIKDVAKRANVSVATVSRVINNTGYVNIETRHLVEKAIEELGYVPNELARSLFRKKSKIIGLIVPHISTYFFGELIEAIEDAVTQEGYKLMIFNSKDDAELEKKYLNVLNQYNIDGLILTANTRSAKSYLKLNIPILTIDHIIDSTVPSITSDNVRGGELAARKLIENGAKKIIHFRGPSDLITVVDRARGFYQVVDEHNIEAYSFDLDFKNPDINDIEMFIKKHPDVDGIFCSSDIIALYAISALKKLGYNIPEDVQVIGFDNIELSGVLVPKLTTIAQPIDDFGKVSMKIIKTLLQKKELEEVHQVLPVNLIERDTTKKA